MTVEPRALLLVGTSDQARVVGAMRAVGLASETAIDHDLVEPRERAVVVVDPDVLGPDPFEAIDDIGLRAGGSPVVFLSGPCDRARLSRLLGQPSVAALVARDHVTSDEELRHALTCIAHGPRFGWEGLMTPEADEMVRTLVRSGDRDVVLEEVADFLAETGLRRRIVRRVQDVADELITNAVYDAPVDEAGNALYASRDRREAVELGPESHALLRVARDPSHVAISMTDRQGSLAVSTVRYYLSKGLRRGDDQVDDKLGGAGLGLTRIYESVDRMTVKVTRRACTEVMAMIEIGGARRDMASRPPGLVLAEAASERGPEHG